MTIVAVIVIFSLSFKLLRLFPQLLF
jgi:hypothetical protein